MDKHPPGWTPKYGSYKPINVWVCNTVMTLFWASAIFVLGLAIFEWVQELLAGVGQ